MAELGVFHEYGEELERRMRLQTFPLAVRMLEGESEIPEGLERPARDLGYHVATCQGFAKSRREGAQVAMMKEDMWCPESVIGLGLAEPPQDFFDGYQRFPRSVDSLEAGSAWAYDFPKLGVGKYTGIASAPLKITSFAPDVVVIYCDSAQLTLFLAAAIWKKGRTLVCPMSSKSACIYSVVPPLQDGEYQVTVPCPGDRRWAGAQRDEMIFSVPVMKLEELLTALRRLEEHHRLPYEFFMETEIQLPENYKKMGRMMGMNWL